MLSFKILARLFILDIQLSVLGQYNIDIIIISFKKMSYSRYDRNSLKIVKLALSWWIVI